MKMTITVGCWKRKASAKYDGWAAVYFDEATKERWIKCSRLAKRNADKQDLLLWAIRKALRQLVEPTHVTLRVPRNSLVDQLKMLASMPTVNVVATAHGNTLKEIHEQLHTHTVTIVGIDPVDQFGDLAIARAKDAAESTRYCRT